MDDAQAVLQRFGHDPWGRRRNADGSDDTWSSLGSLVNTQDHSGYTGHEQLDQLGLVHMNGRIYDPMTARMVSADPTVPDASNLQSLNRYSYVLNNALAYTDPSGFKDEPDALGTRSDFSKPSGADSHLFNLPKCQTALRCDAVIYPSGNTVGNQAKDAKDG